VAAAAGTLLPVGGAIGYGFGLLADLLTGGLSGGPTGRQVPPVTQIDGPYGASFFVLVLDPSRFGGDLVTAAQQLIADARNTPPAKGVDRVRVPGDRARRVRRQRLAEGIPIHHRRWQALRERLRACAVDPPVGA
jgi:L-lactate dehydrogenase